MGFHGDRRQQCCLIDTPSDQINVRAWDKSSAVVGPPMLCMVGQERSSVLAFSNKFNLTVSRLVSCDNMTLAGMHSFQPAFGKYVTFLARVLGLPKLLVVICGLLEAELLLWASIFLDLHQTWDQSFSIYVQWLWELACVSPWGAAPIFNLFRPKKIVWMSWCKYWNKGTNICAGRHWNDHSRLVQHIISARRFHSIWPQSCRPAPRRFHAQQGSYDTGPHASQSCRLLWRNVSGVVVVTLSFPENPLADKPFEALRLSICKASW